MEPIPSTQNNPTQLTNTQDTKNDEFLQEQAHQLFIAYTNDSITQMSTLLLQGVDLKHFQQLRYDYYGSLSEEDHVMYNSILFHAATLTNSPKIIDDVVSTLDIQVSFTDDRYNGFSRAITGICYKGAFDSFQHLVTNYNLDPQMIFPLSKRITYDCLVYAASSRNIPFIRYLLPTCGMYGFFESIKIIISWCDVEFLEELVLRYSDDNLFTMKGDDHNTILKVAIMKGNINLISYIIENGGKIYTPSGLDLPPIVTAIESRQWDVLKHLIHYHNDIDIGINSQLICLSNPLSQVALDPLATPELIDFILQQFPTEINKINIPNSTGHTPLISAARTNNIPVMKHLVENYGATLDTTHFINEKHKNVMINLVFDFSFEPKIETIEYLVSIDLNPSSTIGSNDEKRNVLDILFSAPNLIGHSDRFYISPLLIEYLIDKYYHSTTNFNQIFRKVIKRDDVSFMKLFIEKYQIDVNYKKDSNTPSILQDIIQYSIDGESIQYICSLPNTNQNHNNDIAIDSTLISYLFKNNKQFNLKMVTILIKYGIKPTTYDFITLLGSKTITHAQDSFTYYQCVEYFINELGFDLNQLDTQYDLSNIIKIDNFNAHSGLKTIYHNHARTLIHRYQLNVNKIFTPNTLLHQLADNYQYCLWFITFIFKHSKLPFQYDYIDIHGNTFICLLIKCIIRDTEPMEEYDVTGYDDFFDTLYDDDEIMYDEFDWVDFEALLDGMVDSLIRHHK